MKLNLEDIGLRITEKYRHLWLNKKTGALVLTTDAYYLRDGRKRTVEIDISNETTSRHAKLAVFEKTHFFVCEGWKDRFK